ncbi:MAG TPA: hypothetical protein VMI75_29400 [Polyangiaceae bacterium]|nr:hypothetical protein [Polyangiaceae bacterium]
MRAVDMLRLLAALATAAAACSTSQPAVVPFPEAGDPCSTPPNIDCARFSGVTCTLDAGAGCAVHFYGCADGGYFVAVDDSKCPEAGPDTSGGVHGDVSLIPPGDATTPDAD